MATKTETSILRTSRAFAGYSVDDVAKAKQFYADTLGLDAREEEMGLSLHLGAGAPVFLYPKPDHRAATFTVLNFPVDDIDETVAWLESRGVRFEHYGGDTQTDARGVYRGRASNRGPDIAWFKDPAGNILSVLQEK